MRRLLPYLGVWLLLAPGVADARRVELPKTVQVEGRRLKLNGKATFRKFIFSIYDVGLYLERPTKDRATVLGSKQVKRLHLRLRRDAPKDQMINILRWRLQTVAGEGYPKIQERVDTLLQAIPDAKAGEDLLITWVPDRGTVLSAMDGRQILIEGKDFADALFNVWLEDRRLWPGLMGTR